MSTPVSPFQYATVALPSPALWTGTNIGFDGYVLIMVAMPAGYNAMQVFIQGFNPVMPLASRWRFWVAGGQIDGGSTLPYNASLDPPNTQYAAFWYDINDVLISAATSLFTVSSSPYVLTVPTLTPPILTNTIPDPGVTNQPSGGGGGGMFNANEETPTGTIDGTNVVFTLFAAPLIPTGLFLFQNGIMMLQGIDYTLSGKIITFTNPPQSTPVPAVIRAWYQY